MATLRKWTKKLMIERASDYLVERLKAVGFTVMRYDSYSSNSVYLKLDEGVTGTIRISDHIGKKHLHYKYVLLTDIQEVETKYNNKGYVQYLIPMHYVDQLINKAIYDRQSMIERYGIANYNAYRHNNRTQGLKKDGFWRKAEYV